MDYNIFVGSVCLIRTIHHGVSITHVGCVQYVSPDGRSCIMTRARSIFRYHNKGGTLGLASGDLLRQGDNEYNHFSPTLPGPVLFHGIEEIVHCTGPGAELLMSQP